MSDPAPHRRPHLVLVRQSDLDETRVELAALIGEAHAASRRRLDIIRVAQRTLARGSSPATALDELERLELQTLIRLTAAGVTPVIHESCVDERVPGHGVAA